MQKDIFLAKSTQMGDFYVYFQKPDGSRAYAVCTSQLTEDYMQAKLKRFRVKEDEALLWNWNYSGPMAIKYSGISKLIPLSSVLKNDGG